MMLFRRARLLRHLCHSERSEESRQTAQDRLHEESRRFFVGRLRRPPQNDIHERPPRLRSMNKNQRGFTLLEMLLAILIGSLIAGGITATIFQVVMGSARTNNHMTAVRQVQNAGYWVSHDAQMAQNVTVGAASGFPLTLSWIDSDSKTNQAIYSLENMSSGTLKQLRRTFSKTAETTKTGIMAQFIDSASTSCALNNGVLTLNVTATVGGQTETRVYDVIPRPDS